MKDIKNYEGLYAITKDGKVWSHKRQTFISQRKNHNGYSVVNLHKANKIKTARVHRLVAEAYLPNPDNLPIVHHRNAIRTDCRVENLEWVTHEKNMFYKTIDGLVEYLRSLGYTIEAPKN